MMAAATVAYGRKHQQGLNVITVVAMAAFHAAAVAAFFFIDRGAILAAIVGERMNALASGFVGRTGRA